LRIDTDDRERTGFGERLYRPGEYLRGCIARMPVITLLVGLRRNLLLLFIKLFGLRFCLFGSRALVWAVSIDTNRIDCAIGTDTARQLFDHFHRIFAIIVDHFGAE